MNNPLRIAHNKGWNCTFICKCSLCISSISFLMGSRNYLCHFVGTFCYNYLCFAALLPYNLSLLQSTEATSQKADRSGLSDCRIASLPLLDSLYYPHWTNCLLHSSRPGYFVWSRALLFDIVNYPILWNEYWEYPFWSMQEN